MADLGYAQPPNRTCPRSLLLALVEQGPSRLHARALNAEERREVQELLVRLGCETRFAAGVRYSLFVDPPSTVDR